MTMTSHRTHTLAATIGAASIMLLAGSGQSDAIAAPKVAPAPAATPDPTTANVPPEWLAQMKSGRLRADPVALMAYSAWLFQHQERLNEPYLLRKITALYSCDEGQRAAINDVERAAIYARARQRLLQFFQTAPTVITINETRQLGSWQPDISAFGWAAPDGTTRRPVAAPGISVDSEKLVVMCQRGPGFPLFEVDMVLRMNNGMLSPLEMSQAEGSQLADRLGTSRYVTISWRVSLDSPSGIKRTDPETFPRVDIYARSAIVRDRTGREIGQF